MRGSFSIVLFCVLQICHLSYYADRLAGAALIAPVVNYWWKGFPVKLSTEAYYQQLPQDQWTLRVAHYIPWLIYWWNTQKWFPASSVAAQRPDIFSRQDIEILSKLAGKAANKVTFLLGETTRHLIFYQINTTRRFFTFWIMSFAPTNHGSKH